MTAIPLALMVWGGFAVALGLMGVAFWILLIALIVLLVRGGWTTARASGEPAARPLDERYARGEITREDFLARPPRSVKAPPGPRATTRGSADSVTIPRRGAVVWPHAA
jgi:hypothetical protein